MASGDKILKCTHEKCLLPELGRLTPSTGETFRTRQARAKHMRILNYHPCCTAEKQCKGGSKIRKFQQAPSIRRKLAKLQNTKLKCDHLNCLKVFSNTRYRDKHLLTKHICGSTCQVCTRYQPEPLSDTLISTPMVTDGDTDTDIDTDTEEAETATFREQVETTLSRFDTAKLSDKPSSFMTSDLSLLSQAVVIAASEDNRQLCVPFTQALAPTIHCLADHMLPRVTAEQSCMLHTLANSIIDVEGLVSELYKMRSYEETYELLRKHRPVAALLFSPGRVAKRSDMLPLPTLAALLSFKDELNISDHSWKIVEDTFQLPNGYRIASIRALRNRQNLSRELMSTVAGCANSFFDTLTYGIRLEKPKTNHLQFKISFDAGRVTNQKSEELTCLELITGKSTSQCKSPDNVHLLSLYMGTKANDPEDLETLRKELKHVIEGIKRLKETENTWWVDGVKYMIEFMLCCDMKALAIALGLVAVWKTNCTYRCCWCNVSKLQISDWDITSWEFRDIEKMLQFSVKNLPSTRKAQAKKNCGQWEIPLFDLPLSVVVPCVLHLSMSMVKMMLRLLVSHIAQHAAAVAKFIQVLTSDLKLKLLESQTLSFSDRVQKSKWNRPELLKILESYEKLLTCFDEPDPTTGRSVQQMFPELSTLLRKLFQQLWYLLSIACSDRSDNSSLTEAEWKRLAKQFARGVTSFSIPEKTTTYLHVFVYHIGYFYCKYDSLERVSNYSIEGTVKWVKRQIASASSHFGGRNQTSTSTSQQVLEKHNRMQPIMKQKLKKKIRKSDKNWHHKIKKCNFNKETIFTY